MAKALSAALQPLVDLCLELGITSPELESLLRVAFVQRAFDQLPKHPRTGRSPSVVQVGLATGVHRAEVSKIRAAGGTASARETMQTKRRLYSKSARVLAGWTTDPKFLTSAGLPMDLPVERIRRRRSFQDLVDQYAPGNFPTTVLKEMRRRGYVELIDTGIVRYKTSTPRQKGVNPSTVADASERIKRLGDTLFQNILDAKGARLYEETGRMPLTPEQLKLFRPILERRTKVFLQALENEFRVQGVAEPAAIYHGMGVSVFSWDE